MKNDVLTFVTNLSNSQADLVAISQLYDEVVYSLGARPWLTQFTTITNAAGNALVSLGSTVIKPMVFIFDGRVLNELDIPQLQFVNLDWRTAKGKPYAFVTDSISEKSFLLFPIPTTSSIANSTTPSQPTEGQNDAVTVLYTEFRSTLPVWLEWVVGLLVFAREFGRSSDHYSKDLSEAAQGFAEMLMAMVA